jgi:hypothetical protein
VILDFLIFSFCFELWKSFALGASAAAKTYTKTLNSKTRLTSVIACHREGAARMWGVPTDGDEMCLLSGNRDYHVLPGCRHYHHQRAAAPTTLLLAYAHDGRTLPGDHSKHKS